MQKYVGRTPQVKIRSQRYLIVQPSLSYDPRLSEMYVHRETLKSRNSGEKKSSKLFKLTIEILRLKIRSFFNILAFWNKSGASKKFVFHVSVTRWNSRSAARRFRARASRTTSYEARPPDWRACARPFWTFITGRADIAPPLAAASRKTHFDGKASWRTIDLLVNTGRIVNGEKKFAL